MSFNLTIPPAAGRKEKYHLLLPQLEALLSGENDLVARAANVVAALKETFGFFWVGFYFVKNNGVKEELVLGPFQGTVACMRIGYGKGVCGSAWENGSTIIVDDVDQFPGHIACSSLSRSEIVIPVHVDGKIIGVLDVDSDAQADFSVDDKEGLENVIDLFARIR